MAAEHPVVLVLDGADQLLRRPRSRFVEPDRLLWATRSTAQHAPGLTLVLVGGPATTELIEGRDEAFLGWGTVVQLKRLDADSLAAAVVEKLSDAGLHVDASAARRLAQLSEGLPAVARLLTGRLIVELARPQPPVSVRESTDSVGSAWRAVLVEQAAGLRVAVRLLAALHRAALPVCRSLALGRAPYSAGRPSEISRALRALHIIGVVESPGPRQWRLVDPLLAAWLRGEHDPAAARSSAAAPEPVG